MFEDLTAYNLLKWSHMLSAFRLFGTGLGRAFYKWMADRTNNLHAQAITGQHAIFPMHLTQNHSDTMKPSERTML